MLSVAENTNPSEHLKHHNRPSGYMCFAIRLVNTEESVSHHYMSCIFSKEAGKLCESCTIIIVRQHGPLGSGTVIWPCLTASNHAIHDIPSCDKSCSSAGLSAQHFNEHALHTRPCLIPKECYAIPPLCASTDPWALEQPIGLV